MHTTEIASVTVPEANFPQFIQSQPNRSLPVPPSHIAYEPTERNIPLLKKFIIDKFSDSAFNREPPFPSMKTTPGHIHLKPNTIPMLDIHRFLFHHWKNTIKASLDHDIQHGIIKPIPIGTPVTWCSPMVIVHKKDGTPRRTVDYQELNKQCLCEPHHCESPFHLASKVPTNTKKMILVAVDSYHVLEIDEESQSLTTFITEWGCTRATRFYCIRGCLY